jgi:hypothetical protein
MFFLSTLKIEGRSITAIGAEKDAVLQLSTAAVAAVAAKVSHLILYI